VASEARRAVVRIGANYFRLFASVILGLLLVRLVLRGVGNDGWSLIALLGSTVGVAAMLQDVVRASMIRELGEADHAGDDEHFRTVYNSAAAVTAGAAVVTLLLVSALCLVLPFLRIPDELMWAARWLVLAKAVESFVYIFVAAPVNMYIASERMVHIGVWMVLFRAAPVIAAVLLFVVLDIRDPARGLTLYAWVTAAAFVLFQLAAAASIMLLDRRLVPDPGRVSRAAMRDLLRVGGWNFTALTSMNLHVRIGSVIMNLFFGLFGNLVFGLASQLSTYVRMLTMGVTFGLDAVATRLSAGGGQSIQSLCHHSTRLHGIVAFPAGLGMLVLAEPILVSWVGDRIEDPATTVAPTVALIRIMTIGMIGRAVADGWIKILYGAGHVARYAPLILAGGLANPIVAVALIMLLPEPVRYTGVAWSYAAVLVVVHLWLLHRLTARLIGMAPARVLAPLLRPFLVTVVTSPILFVAVRLVDDWDLLRLAIVAAVFGVVYFGLTILVVFEREEQRRIASLVRQRPSSA
jgi:hypothetical protein